MWWQRGQAGPQQDSVPGPQPQCPLSWALGICKQRPGAKWVRTARNLSQHLRLKLHTPGACSCFPSCLSSPLLILDDRFLEGRNRDHGSHLLSVHLRARLVPTEEDAVRKLKSSPRDSTCSGRLLLQKCISHFMSYLKRK